MPLVSDPSADEPTPERIGRYVVRGRIAAGGMGGGVEKTVYEVQYREPVPEPVGVPSTAGFGDDREFDAELPETASLAVGALTPEQIAAELAWWDSEAHDPTKRKKAAAEVYAEAVENKRLMIAQFRERMIDPAVDRMAQRYLMTKQDTGASSPLLALFSNSGSASGIPALGLTLSRRV